MRISARKLANGTLQVAHGDVGCEIVVAEFKLDEPVGNIRVATAWKSAMVPPVVEQEPLLYSSDVIAWTSLHQLHGRLTYIEDGSIITLNCPCGGTIRDKTTCWPRVQTIAG